MAVDRVERLTNLLALLLETVEPLSLVQIAAELDGQYPDKDQSRRASFERDKAALRDIGVPIDTEIVAGGPYAGQTRYSIDRRSYELTDLDLDPDEVRALQVAVAAVRTGTSASKDAIWKLGGALGSARPAVSAVVPARPELPTLRAAVASKSTITFGYRGERRMVDPWGLLLRSGFWYVIGHDHDRGERRTFRVDRFDGTTADIEVGPPAAFQRPASFDPRTALPVDPKEIGVADDHVDAIVEVDAIRAVAVEAELGSERVTERLADGSVRFRVPAGNGPAFRSWLLGLLDHAQVVEPASVRADITGWLRDAVAATER